MNDFCVRRRVGAAGGEADNFPGNAATQEPVRFPDRLTDINLAISAAGRSGGAPLISRFYKFAGDQMRCAIRVLRIDAKKTTS